MEGAILPARVELQPVPRGCKREGGTQSAAEANRHPTVPPSIAFPYLRGALRWVTAYAPVTLEARAREWNAAQVQEQSGRSRIEHRANGEAAVRGIRKR